MADTVVVPPPDPVAALTAKVTELEGQLKTYPGWLAKIEGKIDGLGKTTVKDAPPPVVKDDDKVSKLERELAAIRTESVTAKKQSAIIAGTSGIGFFDADDVLQRMTGQVQQREDGTFFVKAEEVLPTTGAKIATEISVGEAVKRLAKEKPYLVKGEAKGGLGATTGGATTDVMPSFEEMLRNPNVLAKWRQTDNAGVNAKSEEYYANRAKGGAKKK